jgi:DnaJ-domain-containing protein 1
MDDGHTSAAQADYQAWRDRMRSKAERNKGLFTAPEAEPAPRLNSAYWDPESLFQDDGTVDVRTDNHYAVLDLRDGASPDEIAHAYRNLAKLHHPDRWVGADAETRQHHEDCMRAVNEAYHALRASQPG